jgi:hypothetical protein
LIKRSSQNEEFINRRRLELVDYLLTTLKEKSLPDTEKEYINSLLHNELPCSFSIQKQNRDDHTQKTVGKSSPEKILFTKQDEELIKKDIDRYRIIKKSIKKQKLINEYKNELIDKLLLILKKNQLRPEKKAEILEILHEELQFSASRLQKKTSHAPVRPEHVQTTPVAEKQRQTIPPGNLLHVLLTDLENPGTSKSYKNEILRFLARGLNAPSDAHGYTARSRSEASDCSGKPPRLSTDCFDTGQTSATLPIMPARFTGSHPAFGGDATGLAYAAAARNGMGR